MAFPRFTLNVSKMSEADFAKLRLELLSDKKNLPKRTIQFGIFEEKPNFADQLSEMIESNGFLSIRGYEVGLKYAISITGFQKEIDLNTQELWQAISFLREVCDENHAQLVSIEVLDNPVKALQVAGDTVSLLSIFSEKKTLLVYFVLGLLLLVSVFVLQKILTPSEQWQFKNELPLKATDIHEAHSREFFRSDYQYFLKAKISIDEYLFYVQKFHLQPVSDETMSMAYCYDNAVRGIDLNKFNDNPRNWWVVTCPIKEFYSRYDKKNRNSTTAVYDSEGYLYFFSTSW